MRAVKISTTHGCLGMILREREGGGGGGVEGGRDGGREGGRERGREREREREREVGLQGCGN